MCKVFFFLLHCVGRRDLSAGPEQKKHHPGCFFFFAPAPGKGRGRTCRHGASPSPAFPRGRSKKKNTTQGGVLCFACGPARTLTHSLRAWAAMPPPRRGGVFFFLLRPRPDRGGVFFFAVAPPGRSLTHCELGRFRQGPGGVFFFLLRPRRVFLDNNRKCLGYWYYIESKKTRRGHSKKKKHHFLVNIRPQTRPRYHEKSREIPAPAPRPNSHEIRVSAETGPCSPWKTASVRKRAMLLILHPNERYNA